MNNQICAITVKFSSPIKKIPGIETIIIDNSPPNKNLGFATAINIGIKKAISLGAEKIILLNPDLKINKEQILKLTKSRFEIVAPILKSKRQGKVIYDFGGKINWWIGRTTHLEKKDPIASLQDDVEYVSGACMVIDKKVFERIGLFDPRFFMYFEDVDFCLRARHAGFTVALNPSVVVEHDLETVKLSKNKTKMKHAWKSNLEFVQKWVPWYFKLPAMIYLFWLRCKIFS